MKSIHTKRLLAKSLKTLLVQKHIDKITIKDITDKCLMNRQSFYYHFRDSRELLEWTVQEDFIQALGNKKEALIWEDSIPMILSYMENNKHLFINGDISLSGSSFNKVYYDFLFDIAKSTIDYISKDYPLSPESTEKNAQYYVLSIFSYLDAWIRGHIKRTPSEINEFFTELFTDHVVGMTYRIHPELLEK